ncbi:MAG: hypothetical protein AAGA92_00075 [Planctomycetota bacterium]
MVAPRTTRRVVCTIVRVHEQEVASDRFRSRPSDLLPWADPYICQLVENLQKEVREDRAREDRAMNQRLKHLNPSRNTAPQADLEPPSPVTDADWDWGDEPNWTRLTEPTGEPGE